MGRGAVQSGRQERGVGGGGRVWAVVVLCSQGGRNEA